MVLRCLTCGAENPAANLYCGQCGADLHRTAMETPQQGRDRRGDENEAEARAREEAERKRRTEIARWKEIELESRGIFMPWNLKEPASDPARDAARGRTTVDEASKPREPRPPDRNVPASGETVAAQNIAPTSMPPVPDPVPTDHAVARQNHGKRTVEFLSRRNLALAVLAAALVLAAFQWRLIRDSVVPYVQNNIRQARQQDMPVAAPPALATENSSRAPVVEPPVAAAPPEERTGSDVPPAIGGNAAAPGSAEMYQAAHASDATLRAAWLWKAVRAGNPQATVELAKMYEDGDGVGQSCDQARLLLKAAAAKGNEDAKSELQQLPLKGGCSDQ